MINISILRNLAMATIFPHFWRLVHMCKKCPEMFFTKNGYQQHLMHNHKIQNVDQYEPEIIEKQFRFMAKMDMK